MILIGLGANLPGAQRQPRQTLEAALSALGSREIHVLHRSSWYSSPPSPPSDQPWFVNGVASVTTPLGPEALLEQLHELEHDFGRQRTIKNVARVLDLDLLSYDALVLEHAPILPHPRLGERAFVLLPMRDVAPDWCHPLTGATIDEMLARLPPNHQTSVIDKASP